MLPGHFMLGIVEKRDVYLIASEYCSSFDTIMLMDQLHSTSSVDRRRVLRRRP